MPASNFIVIMMDQLSRDGVGCYGGAGLTPNIDRLASSGTRFTRAYTPSPICVPARAAFQSGLYVHQNRCWSNAQPYSGEQRGWAHVLRDAGHRTVSIGKLHYRSTDDDNGYVDEIHPLHVKDGEGWVHGLLRREDHTAYDASGFAADRGPGEDAYSEYDRSVRDATVRWLANAAAAPDDQPFALFVSFLRPHYPLTCPPGFYSLYDPDALPPIRDAGPRIEYRNPVISAFRQYNDYDDWFPDDAARRVARASYFGLCSFADALVGDVLDALHASGLADDTVIALTSDHGEMNGHKGLWTKMTMYEDSVAIPLVLAGPGIPVGICDTQASLVDIHPTALAACGASPGQEDHDRPGIALQNLAGAPYDPTRQVFSEYHDGGAITGFLMIRDERWKYVVYPGFAPQLFDLQTDPYEEHDLGLSASHQAVRERLHQQMTGQFGDPEAINRLAFADQAARIAALGGAEAIRLRANYDHTPVG